MSMSSHTRTALALIAASTFVLGCSGNQDGEAKQALYTTYEQAIHSGDYEALKTVLSADALREMEQSGADVEVALEMIAAMTPASTTVKEPLPGESEDLLLKGTTEMGAATGRVAYVRENGEWRIQKVSWDMSIDSDVPTWGKPSAWNPDYEIDLNAWFWSSAPKMKKIEAAYLAASPKVRKADASPFLGDGKPEPVLTFDLEETASEVTFSPDGGHLIAAGYSSHKVDVWETWGWSKIAEATMDDRPTGMAASPAGDVFVTGDVYSNLNVWPIGDAGLGDIEWSGEQPALAPLSSVKTDLGKWLVVAISDNAKLLAAASVDNMVSVWSLDSQELLAKAKAPFGFKSIAFSPAGPVLAAGTRTNKFVIWDLRKGSGRVFTVPKADKNSEVTSVAFSPDGKRLVTGHTDSSISVWDVETGEQVHDFYVPNATTWAVRYSPGGEVFASAQANNHIYVWEANTATQLAVLRGHEAGVLDIAFSPDGGTLASVAEDKSVIIWQ